MEPLNTLKEPCQFDHTQKVKSIDLNFLEVTFTDDLSFIIPLLKTVKTESKQFVQRLSDQVLVNDFTAIAKSAHSMRSTGAYIGATLFATLISQLEQSAHDSNYIKVRLLFVEIQKEIKLILRDIDEYLIAKLAGII